MLTLQSSPKVAFLPSEALSDLATDLKAGFLKKNHKRFQAGEPAEDIDVTHRDALDYLLDKKGTGLDEWDEAVRDELVAAWQLQKGWL